MEAFAIAAWIGCTPAVNLSNGRPACFRNENVVFAEGGKEPNVLTVRLVDGSTIRVRLVERPRHR